MWSILYPQDDWKIKWLRDLILEGEKKSNQYNSGVAQINPKYFLNTQIKELGPYQDRKFSTYMRFLRISREMVSPGHPLLGIPHYLSVVLILSHFTPVWPLLLLHSLRCLYVTGLAGDIRRAGAGLWRGLQYNLDQAVMTDMLLLPGSWALTTAGEPWLPQSLSPQSILLSPINSHNSSAPNSGPCPLTGRVETSNPCQLIWKIYICILIPV